MSARRSVVDMILFPATCQVLSPSFLCLRLTCRLLQSVYAQFVLLSSDAFGTHWLAHVCTDQEMVTRVRDACTGHRYVCRFIPCRDDASATRVLEDAYLIQVSGNRSQHAQNRSRGSSCSWGRRQITPPIHDVSGVTLFDAVQWHRRAGW